MRKRQFIHSLVLATAALLQAATLPARADNAPLWSFTVPTSTLISDGSTVSSITTDVAGNTLIILQHTKTTMNIPFPAGTQLILLDGRGRLVGSGDFAGLNNASPVFVSAKKAIISSGGLQEVTVGVGKTLEVNPVPLQSVDEVLANAPDATTTDRKFVHSSVTASSKVTEIRCYLLKKLKPVSGCHCTEDED